LRKDNRVGMMENGSRKRGMMGFINPNIFYREYYKHRNLFFGMAREISERRNATSASQ